MAHSQPGYPPQGYGNENNAGQAVPGGSPPPNEQTPAQSAAGRRKRQYAGQAYDFGAGANSTLGGQTQGGSGYPAPSGTAYPAYGQQPPQPGIQQPGLQQPSYGADYGVPTPAQGVPQSYGQQQPTVGGYQPSDIGYPAHGATGPLQGVGGITQGMSNMGMGAQTPQQPAQMQARPQLNQLHPTDLLNQPFNVAELEYPPPPIILPPNVSMQILEDSMVQLLILNSQALLHHQQLMAHPNMFALHLTPFRLLIRCSKNLSCHLPWSSSPTALFTRLKTQYPCLKIR